MVFPNFPIPSHHPQTELNKGPGQQFTCAQFAPASLHLPCLPPVPTGPFDGIMNQRVLFVNICTLTVSLTAP